MQLHEATLFLLAADVGVGEAFTALWPVLTAATAGYGALFALVVKQNAEISQGFRDRLEDKDATIKRISDERDDLLEIALRSTAVAEHQTGLRRRD